MAKKLPPVDVVLVGFGWTAAILGQELTEAGLDVLAIERGSWRDTSTDFAVTFAQDELRYMWRRALFEEPARETVTFRNTPSQEALPMRHLGSFLPATGVGGAGVHWNGQTWRFLPTDFVARSHNEQRYGPLPADMTVQDWGITYDELEPHYDKFEYLCGISGKAGNLKGQIQPGGNPFEGPRTRDYPNPPLDMVYGPTLFEAAAKATGNKPFPCPAANMSRAYTNPLGVEMGPCTYCGFCEKFGCGNNSKASPQTTVLPVLMRKKNFELRTECEVLRVNHDAAAKRATGVTYIDAQGEEWEQPAEMVIMCAYALHNPRLLLLSGIGTPYDPKTGKARSARTTPIRSRPASMCFSTTRSSTPSSAPARSASASTTITAIISTIPGWGLSAAAIWPAGTPMRGRSNITRRRRARRTGAPSGRRLAKNYLTTASISTHGAVMSHRNNYLDLDPTYRDIYGRPLMRMTFDFTDNEHKMSDYLTDRATDIAKAMNAREIHAKKRTGHYSIVPYQTTHNTGGAIMGADPKTSVVNKYPAKLGPAQSVRAGRLRLPAERRLQPDRHGRRAGLSRRRRDQDAVSEKPRPWCRHDEHSTP